MRKKINPLVKYLRCFYVAFEDTIKHDGVEHSGYMAFLGLLSLFPFLIFLVSIAGMIGLFDVGSEFVAFLFKTLPSGFMKALEPRINEIVSGPPLNLLTLAIIGVIWTASSSVEGLRTALNKAYRVATPPSYVLRRLRSIVEFFVLTLGIIVGMSLIIFIPVITEKFKQLFILEFLWGYLRYGLSSAIFFLVVALLYYVLPNIKQKFVSVFPGSVVVVILWTISASGFSIYLENFHQVNLVYGSLGGFIVALLFFYITALIFIYGAELNYHFEKARGHKIVVKDKIKK